MANERKLILFDLDGTIIYSTDAIFDAINTVVEKEGCKPFSVEELLEDINTPLEKRFKERCHGDPDILMEKFRDEYIRSFMKSSYVYSGMIPLLDKIMNTGISCALVTLKTEREAIAVMRQLGLYQYFSKIYGTGMSGYAVKPSGEHMTYAMKEYNVEKDQCVMIGDMESDMAGANRAGCGAIGVSWSLWSAEELYRWGAHHVAGTPEELTNILQELEFI